MALDTILDGPNEAVSMQSVEPGVASIAAASSYLQITYYNFNGPEYI